MRGPEVQSSAQPQGSATGPANESTPSVCRRPARSEYPGVHSRQQCWQDAAPGRTGVWHWSLESGVESHRLHPDTFWIPGHAEKAHVQVGTIVKMIFRTKDGWAERMWVEVTQVKGRRYVGVLSNSPCGIPGLEYGRKVRFTADEIIDIDFETDLPDSMVIDL